MLPRAILLVVASVFTMDASGAAQTAITHEQATKWVEFAASRAAGDPDAFMKQLIPLVRINARSFHADPFTPTVTLHRSDELHIYLLGPMSAYALASSEAVRRMEPLTAVPWSDTASIVVSPAQIDSPDIVRVVVQRDGRTVEPLRSTLAPQEFTTRAGGRARINAGTVHFPLDAFEPTGAVVVIAIPDVGPNIRVEVSPESLRMVV